MSSIPPFNLPPLKEEKRVFSGNFEANFRAPNSQSNDLDKIYLPLNDPNIDLKQTRLQEEYIAESPDSDNFQRFSNLGLEISSVIIGNVITHPCIVLRRQCQVNRKAMRYHLSPFTLIPVLVRLQNRQGILCLWKGCSGIFILRGCSVALETFLAEITPFPREISSTSTMKQMSQHVLLKFLTYGLLTPFYCASLVETVQSDIASEKPGVLDCLKEGACRLFKIGSPRSSRLLPMWLLVGPTALHGVSFYTLSSVINYIIQWICTWRQKSINDRGCGKYCDQSSALNYLNNLSSVHFSSFITNVILYPAETLLYRLYLQGTRTIIDNLDSGISVFPVITEYEGLVDGFHTIINEEGISGLYKGIGGLFLEYAIQIVVVKVVQIVFREIELIVKPSFPKRHNI